MLSEARVGEQVNPVAHALQFLDQLVHALNLEYRAIPERNELSHRVVQPLGNARADDVRRFLVG